MCVLAPVRNLPVLCFEEVTSHSVCVSEPVRNGAGRFEIESFFASVEIGSEGRQRRKLAPVRSPQATSGQAGVKRERSESAAGVSRTKGGKLGRKGGQGTGITSW